MSVVTKLDAINEEDYLESEKCSDVRHEYVRGAVYAMTGGSIRHNLITSQLATLISAQITKSCFIFQSDMKVQCEHNYYYPDIVVVCEPIDPTSHYVNSPVIVVEVLSRSTEAKDRLEKRVAYQELTSVAEYVMVSQRTMSVEVVRRTNDGWQLETCSYGDKVCFNSIGFEAPIENIYATAMLD